MSWPIRPSERPLAAGLAAYYFLIVGALYLMKPARNALFLDGPGADRLPWVYIGTALVTWGVIVGYMRVAERLELHSTVSVTLLAAVAGIAGFWLWMRLAGPSSAPSVVFYVWVKVYGVLLPSQFWLLTEESLDPRQAKRLFAPIGAAGILGGIVGSAAAGWLAAPLGTRSLLLIAAGVVIAALLVFRTGLRRVTAERRTAWRDRWQGSPEARHRSSDVPDGRADGPGQDPERHGRTLILTIAAILVLATTAHTIVDWQFNKAAEIAITDSDARTAFFGRFFMVLNAVTLAVQLLATGFVLRFFGVGVALAALPVAFAAGAIGILARPGLWTASLARGAEDALRYSIDQSGRELLFLPVPAEDRRRFKPRIDLIATRVANGAAGVLVLLAIWLLDDPLRYLSLLSLGLVAVWALLVVGARRHYARMLQHMLRVRDLAVSVSTRSRLDTNALEAIRQGLLSDDPDTVQTAVGLAASTDPAAFAEELRRLLRTSEESDQKAAAFHLLAEVRDRSALQEALASLDGTSRELSAEALAYALAAGDPEAGARIEGFLAGDDPIIAIAAADRLLYQSDAAHQERGMDILSQAAGIEGSQALELRLAVTEVVGRHPEVAALVPLLARLLDDQAPQVVRAALTACTTYRSGELILPICGAGLERRLQGMALRALRAMGVRVVGPLTGMLADPRNPRELRSFAARALGRLGGSEATAGLLAGLVADDRKVRAATLKALNYMRRRGEKPSIGRREEAAVIRIEWLDYLALHRLAAALETPATETPTAFVATVVDERLHEAEERLFRALGLRHPIQAVFFAYRGLGTGEPLARAHAIELVDSVVETPERRTLVRLLEAEGRRDRGRIAAAELGRPIPEPEAALVELLDPGDPWLAACAIHALGRGRLGAISPGLRLDLLAHGYGPLDELMADEGRDPKVPDLDAV